jgi:hypothetical protein
MPVENPLSCPAAEVAMMWSVMAVLDPGGVVSPSALFPITERSTMTDNQVCLRPATELAEMIRSRELSSRELLELYLARVERINPAVNAVVTFDRDAAFNAAARADERTAGGGSLGRCTGC